MARRRSRPTDFNADWYGRVLHFGIREHAMGSILSGIVLHGPTRAFGGTFLQFSDYMRGAVRLASLMDIDTIYIWTHDSIGLGEDGPTHQPIEHLAALRAIPNLSVVRPGDPNETAYAWRSIIARGNGSGPVGLILTRQGVPVLEGTDFEGVCHGRLRPRRRQPRRRRRRDHHRHRVGTAVGGRGEEAVGREGHHARTSCRCRAWSGSSRSPKDYRDSVLPPTVSARVAVEAGVAQSWHNWSATPAEIVSIEHYGESADDKTLFREFGFTPEAVAAAAEQVLEN